MMETDAEKKTDLTIAIILPAYKKEFLSRALDSIIKQKPENYKLYVGDDASPEDLEEIVNSFRSKYSRIFYKRFSHNLGSQNLVDHWSRCIELAENEDWIWLFSDDDVMGEGCVSAINKAITTHPKCDVFHINTEVIDQSGSVVEEQLLFPTILTVQQFLKLKMESKIQSYVVEYIFRKEKYESVRGFERFDLAWGADDAMWIKLGHPYAIVTIPGVVVQWRRSHLNITPNVGDINIVRRKLFALHQFISWQRSYFISHEISDDTSTYTKMRWIVRTLNDLIALPTTDKITEFKMFGKQFDFSFFTAAFGILLIRTKSIMLSTKGF